MSVNAVSYQVIGSISLSESQQKQRQELILYEGDPSTIFHFSPNKTLVLEKSARAPKYMFRNTLTICYHRLFERYRCTFRKISWGVLMQS